jgi:hypothetical protein
MTNFIAFIRQNPDLEDLEISRSFKISKNEEKLKSALRSLKKLKTLYIFCDLLHIEECFDSENSIETLSFTSHQDSVDWIELGKRLSKLNYLSYFSEKMPENHFLEFLSQSKLSTLFLGNMVFTKIQAARFFRVFNQIKSIIGLIVKPTNYYSFEGLILDERFEVIPLQYLPHLANDELMFNILPSGKGIRHIFIADMNAVKLTKENLKNLKEKFPFLESLFYHQGHLFMTEK